MNKSRAFLAVLLLIVVMFILSFLITIMASRVIPPKEELGKARQPAPIGAEAPTPAGESNSSPN